MLDCLRGGEKTGVKGGRALVLVHDLLALFDDSHDGIAGLALWGFVDRGEHLFQPLDLTLGFRQVLLEGRLEFGGFRRLGHLRQRGQNLLLREIDVLQRVEKQVFQTLSLVIVSSGLNFPVKTGRT